MSIVSLNLRTPVPLKIPSTPLGMRYEFAPVSPIAALPSDVSMTRTRPATLIDSMRAGTLFYEV